MKQLLALAEPPHAVFAGNDAVAVGVYQALYQAGLVVPKDMAVMGYDDIELAKYLAPPLSTIHQPKDSLGSWRSMRSSTACKTPNVMPRSWY